ncbi:MAG: RHS repeat-associated core domain-containing protein [Hyphomonadaceae bacterium]|nr:RHS repeat-associated core domain-containing protein [Hyphomonadaceae bacterium]
MAAHRRRYDARAGQFLQIDPIGTKDDPNLYMYVANDPVNNTDPSGAICENGGGLCDAFNRLFAEGSSNFEQGRKRGQSPLNRLPARFAASGGGGCSRLTAPFRKFTCGHGTYSEHAAQVLSGGRSARVSFGSGSGGLGRPAGAAPTRACGPGRNDAPCGFRTVFDDLALRRRPAVLFPCAARAGSPDRNRHFV